MYPISPLPLPFLLREIPDAPMQLSVRGTYPRESLKFLAVVGSRTYTSYGKYVCEKLIAELRGYPVVIVSGLALGIDGIAHQAAIHAGLSTVAVPASGLDDRVLYPATHRPLARNILESGGALVSEFQPTWKPRPESFPQRNRIMAGLSHAIMVIEADLRSGTLITARLAADYSRDVLAVPGPIEASTSRGPHMLLKKGAALIESAQDILEALGIPKTISKQPPLNFDLSLDEQRVVALLATPIARDELVRTLGMSASQASILLSSLELKGVVVERLGRLSLM